MTHLLRISLLYTVAFREAFFDVKKNIILWKKQKCGSICIGAHGHPTSPWLKSVHSHYKSIDIDKILPPYKRISYAPGWSGVNAILIVTGMYC